MRNLILALLFPFTLAAQSLPDSAVAARLGVKKLVILRCEEGQPADTEMVYRFNPNGRFRQIWEPVDAGVQCYPSIPDNMKIVVKNDSGQVIFSGNKYVKYYDRTKSRIDTNGRYYFYDSRGLVTREYNWNSWSGVIDTTRYTYDDADRLLIVTIINRVPVAITKWQRQYDTLGRLISETMWWAWFPQEDGEIPPDPDTRTSKIVYSYDANGLITEAFATDPTHNSYCLRDPEQDPRPVVDNVTFKYVYIY